MRWFFGQYHLIFDLIISLLRHDPQGRGFDPHLGLSFFFVFIIYFISLILLILFDMLQDNARLATYYPPSSLPHSHSSAK